MRLLKSQAEANADFLGDEKNRVSLPPPQPQNQVPTALLPLSHTASSSPSLPSTTIAGSSPSSSPLLSSSPHNSPSSSYSTYGSNNTSPVSSQHLTASLASARGRKASSSILTAGSNSSSNGNGNAINTTSLHNQGHHPNYHASSNSSRKISAISEESNTLETSNSHHNTNAGHGGISSEDGPFFKFYSTMTTVVTKTYTQTRDVDKVRSKFAKQKSSNNSIQKQHASSPSTVLRNIGHVKSNLNGSAHSSISSSTSSSASSASSTSSLSASINPTDSYYVVSSNKSISKSNNTRSLLASKSSGGAMGNHHISYLNVPQEELIAENIELHEQLAETKLALEAYYETFERQKEILKSSLGQLRLDIQTQDRIKNKETKALLENLENENSRLKSQLLKMKGIRKY